MNVQHLMGIQYIFPQIFIALDSVHGYKDS
jgi:hypothetical protein